MRRFLLAATLVLGLLALAPTVSAHEGSVHLMVEARESACTGTRTFCFEITQGNLDDIGPGTEVEVTFRNQGSVGHQFWATTKANADPTNQDTSTGTALGGTQDPVSPGASATVMFTIPDDAQGFYFWCDVGTHEAQGMWILHDITPADDAGGGSPGLGVPVVLLVGMLMAFAWKRRAA